MKKLLLVVSLIIFSISFTSASTLPYDGINLQYNYSIEEGNPESNEKIYETGEFTVEIIKTGNGWKMQFTDNPIIHDYEVGDDNSTKFWLTEESSQYGHKPSTKFEMNTNSSKIAYGFNTSHLYYVDNFAPHQVDLGDLGNLRSNEYHKTSSGCEGVERHYDPNSGMLLKASIMTDYCLKITYEINQNNVDTDDDGLTDLVEIIQYETNPTESDSDNDGLSDGLEVNKYGSDPNDKDTDGDGVKDSKELRIGTDVDDTNTDADDLNDGEELKHGSSPKHYDTDSDGINDWREVKIGTDPNSTDSDGDFLGDSIDPMPTNPLLPNAAILLVIFTVVRGLYYRFN